MPEVYKHRLYKCAVICRHEYKYSVPAFYTHREVIIERHDENRREQRANFHIEVEQRDPRHTLIGTFLQRPKRCVVEIS